MKHFLNALSLSLVYLIDMRNKSEIVNHEAVEAELNFLQFRLTDALDDILATAHKKINGYC